MVPSPDTTVELRIHGNRRPLGYAYANVPRRDRIDNILRPNAPAMTHRPKDLCQIHSAAMERHVGHPWTPVLFVGSCPIKMIQHPTFGVWEYADAQTILDALQHLAGHGDVTVRIGPREDQPAD